jgi:hypothetical protein
VQGRVIRDTLDALGWLRPLGSADGEKSSSWSRRYASEKNAGFAKRSQGNLKTRGGFFDGVSQNVVENKGPSSIRLAQTRIQPSVDPISLFNRLYDGGEVQPRELLQMELDTAMEGNTMVLDEFNRYNRCSRFWP